MSTTITRQMLDEIRKDINEALKEVASKHGLKFYGIGGIRYTSLDFRSRFEMSTGGPDMSQSTLTQVFPFKEGERIRVGNKRDPYTVITPSRTGIPRIQSIRGKTYKLPQKFWGTCRKA